MNDVDERAMPLTMQLVQVPLEQSRALSQNIASAIIASGTKHSELLAISRELSKR